MQIDDDTPVLPEDVLRASEEVDRTLLRWFASLSLRERLRAATRTARTLRRFQRVGPSPRR